MRRVKWNGGDKYHWYHLYVEACFFMYNWISWKLTLCKSNYNAAQLTKKYTHTNDARVNVGQRASSPPPPLPHPLPTYFSRYYCMQNWWRFTYMLWPVVSLQYQKLEMDIWNQIDELSWRINFYLPRN